MPMSHGNTHWQKPTAPSSGQEGQLQLNSVWSIVPQVLVKHHFPQKIVKNGLLTVTTHLDSEMWTHPLQPPPCFVWCILQRVPNINFLFLWPQPILLLTFWIWLRCHACLSSHCPCFFATFGYLPSLQMMGLTVLAQLTFTVYIYIFFLYCTHIYIYPFTYLYFKQTFPQMYIKINHLFHTNTAKCYSIIVFAQLLCLVCWFTMFVWMFKIDHYVFILFE